MKENRDLIINLPSSLPIAGPTSDNGLKVVVDYVLPALNAHYRVTSSLPFAKTCSPQRSSLGPRLECTAGGYLVYALLLPVAWPSHGECLIHCVVP